MKKVKGKIEINAKKQMKKAILQRRVREKLLASPISMLKGGSLCS
jgi:hypothetical protein